MQDATRVLRQGTSVARQPSREMIGVSLRAGTSHGFQAGVYRGFDAALRFYDGYFEVFDEIVIEPDRFIEAGDSVVVPNVAHQRGRDGIEVSARSALVFTIRNRRITRICLYQETDEALKAVGLKG